MPHSSNCSQSPSHLIIQPVTEALPSRFGVLQAEAQCQGYHFLDRLAEGWANGTMRFNGPKEVLLAACLNGELAAIGGLTIEPSLQNALRVRRFYVAVAVRRQGVGRALANKLLRHSAHAGCVVTVNAGTAEAPPFWEALGFLAAYENGYTHMLHQC